MHRQGGPPNFIRPEANWILLPFPAGTAYFFPMNHQTMKEPTFTGGRWLIA